MFTLVKPTGPPQKAGPARRVSITRFPLRSSQAIRFLNRFRMVHRQQKAHETFFRFRQTVEITGSDCCVPSRLSTAARCHKMGETRQLRHVDFRLIRTKIFFNVIFSIRLNRLKPGCFRRCSAKKGISYEAESVRPLINRNCLLCSE